MICLKQSCTSVLIISPQRSIRVAKVGEKALKKVTWRNTWTKVHVETGVLFLFLLLSFSKPSQHLNLWRNTQIKMLMCCWDRWGGYTWWHLYPHMYGFLQRCRGLARKGWGHLHSPPASPRLTQYCLSPCGTAIKSHLREHPEELLPPYRYTYHLNPTPPNPKHAIFNEKRHP